MSSAGSRELEPDDRPVTNRLRPGDSALFGILVSDFCISTAGAMVYMTMVWWVLAQGISELGITLLVLSIFVPLNGGVIVSGVAVARFGARRLLLVSKSLALVGAIICYALLVTETMTLWSLAALAVFVYGSMGPSITADVSRAPALIRLARRRLASFHASNGISVVLGRVFGLMLGGMLAEGPGAATAIVVSAVLVALSLSVTYMLFPRDRLVPVKLESGRQQLLTLSRAVVTRLDRKQLNLATIFLTIAIITVAEGFSEVLLPVALRASELPPTALSHALALAICGRVVALLVAQAVHGKVKLDMVVAAGGAALFVIVLVGAIFGGWSTLVIGMVSAATVASGTAMLAFTTLQLRMTASLQTHAAGMWHSLVLSASATVIFLTGLAKSLGYVFLFAIVALAAFIGLAQALRKPSNDVG